MSIWKENILMAEQEAHDEQCAKLAKRLSEFEQSPQLLVDWGKWDQSDLKA